MERGNVLVIGNSGVGKSTLINSVLGDERAETGWGREGTTKELKIYENENLPFRIIDSVGFEPSFINKHKAIHAIKKWSLESAKDDHQDNQINEIWFCIEGTSSKLFPETIKCLSSSTSMWKSVPIIVVITKSYSVPERKNNIEMVHNAFAKQKHFSKNLRKIIPVVASTYILNETAYAAPDGIIELIDSTNELLPEGLKAAEKDISKFKLDRKKVFAQSIVSTSTTIGVIVGAVPIPFADAALLAPIEATEITTLAKLYEINKHENSKQFLDSIVEVGTVSVAAKAAIDGLKVIPGINLAASVLNAIIAGCLVAAIGEGSIYAFEQIYLGKKTVDDIKWVKDLIEAKISNELIDKVKIISDNITDKYDLKAIAKIISDLFAKAKK